MNKKFIVMAAFAAVFGMSFTACSNDDETPAVKGGNQPAMTRAISFNSFMDGMPQTRGLAANVADVKVDGMKIYALDATKADASGANAFIGGLPFNWDTTNDDAFKPETGIYFWPEYNLNIMALTPKTGGGIGAITFGQAADDLPTMTVAAIIPETLSDQKDIMIASEEGANGTTYASSSVALTFKHALTQVTFKAGIDDASQITKVDISNISLVNICNTGTITYDSDNDVFGVSSPSNKVINVANIVNATLLNDGETDNRVTGGTLVDVTGGELTDALAHNAADPATTRQQQLMVLPQTICSGVTTAGASSKSKLAKAFSDAKAYALGDNVVYNGRFYHCTTAHAAGAWNANDFTEESTEAYLLVNADLYANKNHTNKLIDNTTTVYIPLNEAVLAAGTKYTYTLKFGSSLLNPITFTASVGSWTPGAPTGPVVY